VHHHACRIGNELFRVSFNSEVLFVLVVLAGVSVSVGAGVCGTPLFVIVTI
jgi:hypothetical protein